MSACLSPVAWSDFTWEAFATIATGLAAVAAATFVGLRQTGIAKRQARILDRQVSLAELGLRQQLFDHRFGVYESTKNYLLAIVQHADAPDAETKRAFHIGLNEAKFLFSDEVYKRLEKLFRDTEKFFHYKKQSENLYKTDHHYGDFPDKEQDLLVSFSDDLIALGDFFGDELKLSAKHGASQEP